MDMPVILLVTLLSGLCAAALTENIALGAEVVQSSDYDNLGLAQKAVDGNSDSEYIKGSCTHTTPETDPWWRVDLTRVYKVVMVAITNRGDCCGERIIGAEIRIGNNLDNNGNDNVIAATIGPTHCRGTETFKFEPIEGQYVNIFLPGSDKILTMCEVQVFADEDPYYPSCAQMNLAQGATTVQSSAYDELANSQNAVDGNREANYMEGLCTQTAAENDPWWRVDLAKVHNVALVTVTNRGDCCQEEIVGAEIRIGNCLDNNGNSNELAATIESVPSDGISVFRFAPIKGRYVNIFLPGSDKTLALCEVEVFAELETLPQSTCVQENLALGGTAVQSSTYDEAMSPAQNAVDGNRASSYGEGSCTHTATENDPWWRVDLAAVYSVSMVTITNRGDCCGERIEGAQIRIGNCLDNNGNNNQLAATAGNIPYGGTETFSFEPIEGQFVNIFLPGNDKILTLCEVEVFTNRQ